MSEQKSGTGWPIVVVLLTLAALGFLAYLAKMPKASAPAAATATTPVSCAAAEATPAVPPTPPAEPARQFWPRQVTVLREVELTQITPNGEIKSKLAAQSIVDMATYANKQITIRRGDFSAVLPEADTDFWVRAAAAEDASVARQKAAEEARTAREQATQTRLDEARQIPLQLGKWSYSQEHNFITTEGSVTNISDQPLEGINLDVMFYNAAGQFVKSDAARIEDDPLPPGKTSAWNGISKGDPAITSARIQITDQNGHPVRFKNPGQP